VGEEKGREERCTVCLLACVPQNPPHTSSSPTGSHPPRRRLHECFDNFNSIKVF
jgi:hypothetical protein